MLLVVPTAHTNIPLATATQCCLFSAMADVATPGTTDGGMPYYVDHNREITGG